MAQPAPDTSEMLAVHGALRDTLAAAPGHIGTVAADDEARRALVAGYFSDVIAFLEVHHQAEEVLLFPLLEERCADQASLLARMKEQHESVVDLIGQTSQSLGSWAGGDHAAQSQTVANFEELHALMVEHLREEEAGLLPLCGSNMSAEEWGALPGYSMAHFGGEKIWLVLGLIRQRMTDAQRAEMLAHMPPPAVEMWTTFGEAAFNDLSAAVPVPVS